MYTDYIGNPIAAGDFICYGVKSGSSALSMTLARVKEIVPIHPVDPNDPFCCRGFTDEDLAKGKDLARDIEGRAKNINKPYVERVRADDKAYLLKVNRLQDGWGDWMRVDTSKVVTIHNVTNVVVVSLPEETDG